MINFGEILFNTLLFIVTGMVIFTAEYVVMSIILAFCTAPKISSIVDKIIDRFTIHILIAELIMAFILTIRFFVINGLTLTAPLIFTFIVVLIIGIPMLKEKKKKN